MSNVQEKIAALMRSREKLNSYTQGSKRAYFFGYTDNAPGNARQKGYSDCSSAVRAAIRAAAGIDIGSNTNAQIKNRANGVVVDQTDGYYPDEDKLQPGDCLYFKGNSGHALSVGHVEMYLGSGKCCGHGSGTGPTVKDLRDYCASRASSSRRYFMAVRWVGAGEEAGGEQGALGDRLLKLRSPLMTGADVKDLQEALIALGYGLPEHGADGEYGAETAAAVAAFQRDRGELEVDGEYGALTHAALMEALSALEGEPGDEDAPDEDAPDGGEPKVLIAGGSVYVRKGPSTGYGAVTVAHAGERYPHIATARNGWLCIAIGDGTAWVSSKYAEVEAVDE